MLHLLLRLGLAAAAAWLILGVLGRRTGMPRSRKAHAEAAATIVRLVPAEAGWQIEIGLPPRRREHFETKAPAVDRAREIAHREAPSVLLIHRADGSEQHRHSYDLSARPSGRTQ